MESVFYFDRINKLEIFTVRMAASDILLFKALGYVTNTLLNTH